MWQKEQRVYIKERKRTMIDIILTIYLIISVIMVGIYDYHRGWKEGYNSFKMFIPLLWFFEIKDCILPKEEVK